MISPTEANQAGLVNMPATQASIPIMGLRIGKRFKEKKKVFFFFFLNPFPNHTKQSNPLMAPCTLCALATPCMAEGERARENVLASIS